MTTPPDLELMPPLRVLLLGQPGAGRSALAEWLREISGMLISVPPTISPATLAVGRSFRPDIVLFDCPAAPVTVGFVVTFFKGAATVPPVFVLTNETNEIMRRRCLEERADAVFSKTAELDALRYALSLRRRRVASGHGPRAEIGEGTAVSAGTP